ncbi:MAG: TonB-dependent receptor [Hyphomonadaceae bacterium]
MPTTELENWNAVGAFEGEFGDWGGVWLDRWSASGTFNYATTTATLPDTIGFRVQQALNGFGGPNCNAADLVPDNFNMDALDANGDGQVTSVEWNAVIGTQNPAEAGQNGCMYLNPFSSSYPANGTFGTPNPRYIPGNEISPELSRWLYDDRYTEDVSTNLTFDALVSGGTPVELPGGMLAWAAGAQWRQSEFRDNISSPYMNSDVTPCAWPGQQPGQVGCAPTGQSPYFFFGQDNPSRSDQQQYSYFGELQAPVLDTLSFQLAARREEFPQSGLGSTVYKIAGKWDPVDWLAVRGSFGTNYSTPPASFIPGEITNALSLIAGAGNKYLRVETETLSGVVPETAEVSNFGLIFNFDNLPLDGSLRFSADYFNFKIIDEIKTVSHNSILGTVFVDGAPARATSLINCSAALIDRITFINGQGASGCMQGVTVGDDVTSIRSVRGNGPGAKTAGVDYDVTYDFSALGGDMTAMLTATNVLEYKIDAFQLNGTQLTPEIDGLGYANYSREGDIVSKWRANASLNYSNGNHNLRYAVRYIQGVTDDRYIGTANEQIGDFTTHNLYYQYTLPWDEDMTVRLSIENLTDEDPPFTVQQYSYDPFIGNALGRTIEVGFRKTF